MDGIKATRLKALYIDTLKKEYRSKTLLTLFLLTVAMIFMTNAVLQFVIEYFSEENFSAEHLSRLSMNLFYNFIDLWSIFIAALIGVNGLKSDFSNKVVSQLLSFPLRRIDYLVVRMLGSWTLVSGYYLFSLLFAGILFSFSSDVFLIESKFFFALFNSSLIILATLCLAMAYSIFFPRLIAFFITMVTTGVISLANGMVASIHFKDYFQELGFLQLVLLIVHWVFPRVGSLNQYTNEILTDPSITLSTDYAIHLVHFCLSFGLLVFVVNYFFQRKDI